MEGIGDILSPFSSPSPHVFSTFFMFLSSFSFLLLSVFLSLSICCISYLFQLPLFFFFLFFFFFMFFFFFFVLFLLLRSFSSSSCSFSSSSFFFFFFFFFFFSCILAFLSSPSLCLSHTQIRLSVTGLAPLVALHHSTLTSLHLRHLEFHPLRAALHDVTVHQLFSSLRGLTRLSLTGVEGFSREDWIALFVHSHPRQFGGHGLRSPDRSSHFEGGIGCAAFPRLQHLEIDFVPDSVLVKLGHVYGGRLKTLQLSEYTKIFGEDDVDSNGEWGDCCLGCICVLWAKFKDC